MSSEALAQILGGENLFLADVGASYFMPDTWGYLRSLPTAHFVLFDPVEKNLNYAKQLEPNRIAIVPVALSKKGGAAEFFLANTDSGSSLYPPHPWPGRPGLIEDYFFPLTVTDIETKTLASSLDDHGIDAIHAIKLDTQGSELDIIQGLDTRRLEKLLLVEMEVTLDSYPIMLGAARLPEVIDFFERNGFRFINTRIARKSLESCGCVGPHFASSVSAQAECDVLFVKDITAVPRADCPEFMGDLRRLLTLLSAYYLHGEATETARLAANILPAAREELNSLERSIARFAEYQSALFGQGERSLWHRDHT